MDGKATRGCNPCGDGIHELSLVGEGGDER
jgi:hypothetical protein